MADTDFQFKESRDALNTPLKINVKVDSTFWQLYSDSDFLMKDSIHEMMYYRARMMIPTKEILTGGYSLADQISLLRYKALSNRFFVLFNDITKKRLNFWISQTFQVNSKMRELEHEVKQLRKMRDDEAFRARIRIREDRLEKEAKEANDKPKN